jgi:hypothetical protein
MIARLLLFISSTMSLFQGAVYSVGEDGAHALRAASLP